MKTALIIAGALAVLALLAAPFAGWDQKAESSPGGEESDLPGDIPPIDADRPTVTETAAFALG